MSLKKGTPVEETFDQEFLVVVNRTRQDGLDVDSYASIYIISPPDWVVTDDEDSWHLFIRETIGSFLNTPEGKEAWEDTMSDFNWGDIGDYVPSAFLSEHGIREYHAGDSMNISDVIILNVDWDEVFPEPEEDDEE